MALTIAGYKILENLMLTPKFSQSQNFLGSQIPRMVRVPIFGRSQVPKMVGVPIFSESQVTQMVRVPGFPGSQVLGGIEVQLCGTFLMHWGH